MSHTNGKDAENNVEMSVFDLALSEFMAILAACIAGAELAALGVAGFRVRSVVHTLDESVDRYLHDSPLPAEVGDLVRLFHQNLKLQIEDFSEALKEQPLASPTKH